VNRAWFLRTLGLAGLAGVTDKTTTTEAAAAITSDAPPPVERPPLTSPTVVSLSATSPLPKLSNARDYIILLPKTVAHTSGVRVVGGRNVALVGGYLSTSTGSTVPNVFIGDGAAGGIVHCEGLLIDGSHGGLSDAFHLQCPHRHVQLKMNRVDGLRGAYSKTHADCIQNLGCASLRVEDFTGRSHYNNSYCRRENDPVGWPVGPSTWNRVNMGGYRTNQDAVGTDPKHTLRAISLGTQPVPPGDATSTVNGLLTGSVWLHSYYANSAEAGMPLGQFVWPHNGPSMEPSCRAQVSTDGLSVDWPRWRTSTAPPAEETRPSAYGAMGSGDAKVYGMVMLGPPPGGDYVTAGDAGLAYPRLGSGSV
jgi:hypothetical protein